MAEIKLKTCPFCGGEAHVVKWRKAMAYLPVIDSYQVVCAYCDCRTARHPSKEKAVDVWNRRKDGERNVMREAAKLLSELPTVQPQSTTGQLNDGVRSTARSTDLIDRQAALDIFDDYNVSVENGELEAYSRDRKRMCELPPAQPEPTDINAKEAVYNLAEKIGIHQLFALTVELRGEPIQPEPHEGHWIEGKIYRDVIECNCSECGQLMTTAATVRMNYCPRCGARMKEGESNG